MAARKKLAEPSATPEGLAAQINLLYPGAIKLATDPDLAVKRWPSGVLPIDLILDGGIPRGRMIEVYGGYSTMKSYWLYCALGNVQRLGGRAALIDTEHSFDPDWAAQLGVDVPTLLVSQPEDAEQGIGVLEVLVRQRYDLVGFDSIAAAIPRQHRESMPGEDSQPGALARVMSKGLARINAANVHTSVIFINQTRQKIGVTFGSPVTTSGGLAMQFYASYRMSFTRTGKITETVKQWDGTDYRDTRRVVGHKISATLEKSKLSAPHADCWFVYDLTTGTVDEVNFLIAQAIERGLMTRSSAGHYDIPTVLDKPIHGRDKFFAWVRKHEEVIEWLKTEIVPVADLATPQT